MRRSFGFDAVGALGPGVFNALVVNFLSVIARRGRRPAVAGSGRGTVRRNMLAIFSGFWVRRQAPRALRLDAAGARPRAVPGRDGDHDTLRVAGDDLQLFLTQAFSAPMQVDIWRRAYPQRMRARVFEHLRVLQTASGALAAAVAC